MAQTSCNKCIHWNPTGRHKFYLRTSKDDKMEHRNHV